MNTEMTNLKEKYRLAGLLQQAAQGISALPAAERSGWVTYLLQCLQYTMNDSTEFEAVMADVATDIAYYETGGGW